MTSPNDWSIAGALFEGGCTFVAAACAVYVAQRDARWRKNGLAKQLEDRIAVAQTAADNWHETPTAKKLRGEVEGHGRLLARHSGTLENVATKTDVARIEGSIATVKAGVRSADDGVKRIEDLMMRDSLGARR